MRSWWVNPTYSSLFSRITLRLVPQHVPDVPNRSEPQLPTAVTWSVMHPLLAFFPFPDLLPVTLTRAFWDYLQSKLVASASLSQGLLLEESNPDRPCRLILLMWLFSATLLQGLLLSGVVSYSFSWFNNIYGTIYVYKTLCWIIQGIKNWTTSFLTFRNCDMTWVSKITTPKFLHSFFLLAFNWCTSWNKGNDVMGTLRFMMTHSWLFSLSSIRWSLNKKYS